MQESAVYVVYSESVSTVTIAVTVTKKFLGIYWRNGSIHEPLRTIYTKPWNCVHPFLNY